MKKNTIFLTVLIFVFCFSCDRHSGERPYDYPPARWVSEKPKMWFVIGESDKSAYSPRQKIYGNLILDGQSIEIEVSFNKGSGMAFFGIGNEKLDTRGRCKFHSDKLIVNIDKERDGFFNGLYKTITFIRVPEWIFDVVTGMPTESPNPEEQQ